MSRPVIGIPMQTLDPIPGQTPLCWIMGQTYRTTTPYHPGKTIRVAVSVRPEDNNGVAYR